MDVIMINYPKYSRDLQVDRVGAHSEKAKMHENESYK